MAWIYLDGGRVLPAIVWRFTHSIVRATKIAAGVGQFIGAAMIVYGLFRSFTGAGFGGLWLALIGWFLSQAASASYAEVQASAALAGVRVGDIMSRDCSTIDANLDLKEFAEEHLLRTGKRCFFTCCENGRQTGLVTMNELKRVARERWPFTTVSQIALPLDRVHSTSPDASVTQALEIMVREDINQLPVMSNHELAGVISRGNVLQYLKTHSELKAA